MNNFVSEQYNELAYYTLGLQDACFIHQYIVDAYTAQTATEDTKDISLTFALVGLYLCIEKKYTGKEVQQFHTLMSTDKIKWPNIKLPKKRGEITVETVLNANEGDERNKMIKTWCNSIWNAFVESHSKIIEIADYYENKIR
jgi:Family of unknown function (DUF5946)